MPASHLDRLLESAQPLLKPARPDEHLGQQSKEAWSPEAGTGGGQLGQTLAHAGDSFLHLPALRLRPTPQDLAHRPPEREPLLSA